MKLHGTTLALPGEPVGEVLHGNSRRRPSFFKYPLGRGEIALLSDNSRGVVAYALPPGEVRAGVVVLSVPTWVRSELQRIPFRPLLVGCFAWLARRIMERGFERALNWSRAQGRGAESILILAQRFAHVVLLIVGLIAALSYWDST